MKVATVFCLLLASATAFTAPQFATRAVGAKKAPAKKAPVKKAPVKKAAAKKASPFSSASPIVAESKGYPSFADGASKFRLGKVSGGAAGKVIEPVFIHPTVNTAPVPDFDYKEAAKARVKPGQQQVYAYDDGLTELERKQRGSIPAFLTGGAKNRSDKSLVREDIEVSEYPFGLDADRFQLLFISIFGLFTLVGCLSGSIQLD